MTETNSPVGAAPTERTWVALVGRLGNTPPGTAVVLHQRGEQKEYPAELRPWFEYLVVPRSLTEVAARLVELDGDSEVLRDWARAGIVVELDSTPERDLALLKLMRLGLWATEIKRDEDGRRLIRGDGPWAFAPDSIATAVEFDQSDHLSDLIPEIAHRLGRTEPDIATELVQVLPELIAAGCARLDWVS